jgi:hypothetical protein
MSTQQLVAELLSLSLSERIDVAQAVWQSINEAAEFSPGEEEGVAVAEASRRDAELASGTVAGRSHADVMAAARRVLRCE